MGPMILRREVLPARLAPKITQAIWTTAAVVGLASAATRLLEAWL